MIEIIRVGNLGESPISVNTNTLVLLEKEEIWAQMHAYRENAMWPRSQRSTHQEMPKIDSKSPEARREGQNRFPLTASEETNAANILFQTSGTQNSEFLLVKPPLCGALLQEP